MSVKFNLQGLSNRFNLQHAKKASVESPTSGSLIPTRSNTPDNYRNSNSDNVSDRDSVNDSLPENRRYVSASSINSTDSTVDSPTFEIDVKPKKKNFATTEERRLFVEDYKRKYKTEMCKNWELKGTCKFGDKCCFAHGRHELKGKALTHVKYKTKPCKQYHQTGYCPYGQRCQYLHKEALSPNIFFYPTEDKTKQTYYTYEMLHEINMICNTDADLSSLFNTLPQRSRLSVFTKLAVNE